MIIIYIVVRGQTSDCPPPGISYAQPNSKHPFLTYIFSFIFHFFYLLNYPIMFSEIEQDKSIMLLKLM